jgi:hypothetical protein
VLQLISVLRALAILGPTPPATSGWRIRRSSPTRSRTSWGAVLTAVAVIDQQLGPILLEGAWALVSLSGIATILQRRGSLSSSAR